MGKESWCLDLGYVWGPFNPNFFPSLIRASQMFLFLLPDLWDVTDYFLIGDLDEITVLHERSASKTAHYLSRRHSVVSVMD